MKRILITGKNSYIGNSLKKWLQQWEGKYIVDEVGTKDGSWKNYDFTGYDCIFHVAGIVHRKDAPEEVYEKVNHILAVDIAQKAIDAKVNQFIFMSSGAVYSQNDRRHKTIIVDEQTQLNPCTQYGISKMNAEIDILKIIENIEMKLAILRPPMVYGRNAKGNYALLSGLAHKLPIFPSVSNKRSMIYIDNLCEFVRLVIENESAGIFLPQNAEYVNTTELVKTIAIVSGKKIRCTSIFNWVLSIMSKYIDVVNKAFGSYYYEKKSKEYFDGKYQVTDFSTSIVMTEGKNK